MNVQKIAITIPSDIVVMIDDISKRRGVSRSRFISDVLREKISEKTKYHLKEAYDAVFSDDSVCKEQLETSAWFDTGGNDEGQQW